MLLEYAWREADSLSIAFNFFQENLSFWTPKVHFQGWGKGEGYAVGEFPVIYYLVAQLWKIFGAREYIFYGTTLIFTWLGLFYLFRLTAKILDDSFWAIFVSLTLYTSPLLAYNAWSCVPHVIAFGLVWSGVFYYYQYCSQPKLSSLIIWTVIFSLVGCIKVVFLGIPLAILIAQLLLQQKYQNTVTFQFHHFKQVWLAITLIFFSSWLWIRYCLNFAQQQEHLQFMLELDYRITQSGQINLDYLLASLIKQTNQLTQQIAAQPLIFSALLIGCSGLIILSFLFRKFDKLLLGTSCLVILGVLVGVLFNFKYVIHSFVQYTTQILPQIFNNSFFYWTFIASIVVTFVLIFSQKAKQQLALISILVLLVSVANILLWPFYFKTHQYYSILVLALLPFNLITILDYLKQNYPLIFKNQYLRFAGCALLLISIADTALINRAKYYTEDFFVQNGLSLIQDDKFFKDFQGNKKYYSKYDKAYETITPYIRFIGLKRTDKVIVIHTKIPNLVLYLMDQKGFIFPSNQDLDRQKLQRALDLGAKYLITHKAHHKLYSQISDIIDHKLGTYQEIEIFALKTTT
ncbi:MAG: hypothetical protein LBE20_03435 [Deltaproteobacteria bacterium]|nr:hypothetical protein [Deltaproteobacteria bacterium]